MNRYSVDDIRTMINGRWHDILLNIGVPKKHLSKNHTACPSCGGKDRYRFTNWQNNGGFICNQCTPHGGSGFDLIMLVYGCDFSEALAMVSAQLGINTDVQTPVLTQLPQLEEVTQETDKIERLKAYLKPCKPITKQSPVGQYLIARGLDWEAIKGMNNLYYHPSLDYWTYGDNKPIKIGSYSAMIAVISLNNEMMGIHCTYIEKNHASDYKGFDTWQKLNKNHPKTKRQLPAKKMFTRYSGALKGAMIPLYQIDNGAIAVCEGIETALAVKQMFDLPVWACATAWGMKNIELSKDIQRLYIVADNDISSTGQEAARCLANKAIQKGIEVKQWTPPIVGHDALDELNRQQLKGITA